MVCASALTTERIACAGTTSRMASARAASPSSRVTLMLSSSFTPGRNWLSRFFARLLGVAGVVLPQRHVAAGARAGQRQRRSPGAAAEHRDAFEWSSAHLYAAVRCARALRGRRPRRAASARAARRRADRSGPAPAARRRPRRSWRRCRCTARAAAPPARCRLRRRRDAAPCGSPGWRRRRRRRPARSARRSARGTCASRRAAGRSTTSTTACWNEAHRSATSWSDSGAIFSASSRSAVFKPGQREIRPPCGRCIGRGSAKRVASPRAASLLDLRPARIAEAEQLGGLVEGFADGVVHAWCRAARSRRRRAPRRSGCGRRRRGTGNRETASRRSAAP